MKKFPLNASFEVVGGFWKSGNPNEVIAGTLSCHEGRLEFLTSPTFNRLSDADLRRLIEAFNAPRELPPIDALWGYTSDGRCTLLHLMQNTGAGLTDFGNKVQIAADRWHVGGAVIGFHIESSEVEVLDGAAFYLTKISNWLPRPWGFQIDETGVTYTSARKAIQVFKLDSDALGAEVICEVFATRGTRMKSVPRIRISPRQPKSLDWFFGVGTRLENFFALFLGTSVALKTVQLFQAKESGWLIRRMQRHQEKVNIQSWVRCKADDVARALERWLAVAEEERPVEKTVLGMVRKSSLFSETEFLALAQALEGFGRIRFKGGLIPNDTFKEGLTRLRKTLEELWGDSEITKRCSDAISNANEATFAQRVEQIYDLLSADLAGKLMGERQQFVRKVVQTRNYFTHLGIRKGAAVVDDAKELFLLNQRLHALLRGVMLVDLGISEDLIREPIMYQATRWS